MMEPGITDNKPDSTQATQMGTPRVGIRVQNLLAIGIDGKTLKHLDAHGILP